MFHVLIGLVIVEELYLCGPRKHNCQPFCGPQGRFDCSDSVCSLRPAPLSYLCVPASEDFAHTHISPYIGCDHESGGVIAGDTRHTIFLSRHYDRVHSSVCWRPSWCQPATRARRPPHKFDILFIGVLFLWRRGCIGTSSIEVTAIHSSSVLCVLSHNFLFSLCCD